MFTYMVLFLSYALQKKKKKKDEQKNVCVAEVRTWIFNTFISSTKEFVFNNKVFISSTEYICRQQ